MDIKEQIEKIVNEVKSNDKLKEEFMKEPVKTIEKLIGVDLPDDMIEKVVDGVKAKITVDKIGDVADALKKFF